MAPISIFRLGVAIALLSGLTAASLGCGGETGSSSGNTSGTGGSGGNGQGGTGQGGGSSCSIDPPAEGFGFSVTTADGKEYACSKEYKEEPATIEGMVTDASTPDTWVIDTCPPTADCLPSLVKVNVAGGSKLTIPVNTIVSVTYVVKSLGGVCYPDLLVKNLPTWAGTQNPVGTDEAPWFDTVGVEGSPFALDQTEQCREGSGGSGCERVFYKLRFMLKGDPNVTTGEVAIGDTESWSVPSGPAKGSYTVRNVTSDSGYCEIPGLTLAWVARAP